jgi:DNA-binding FrmR family transcriptional regulator
MRGSITVAHTTKDKDKLLARVRRIAGQVAAIEKALTDEDSCSSVLQLIASCRGAIGGLMAEVVEGHVRCHVMDGRTAAHRGEAAEELIDVLKTYLK